MNKKDKILSVLIAIAIILFIITIGALAFIKVRNDFLEYQLLQQMISKRS